MQIFSLTKKFFATYNGADPKKGEKERSWIVREEGKRYR
jgi:hypothetical protein